MEPVTLSPLLIVAAVAVILFLGAIVAFRIGERREDFKRDLLKLMKWLRDSGFEYCDDLVEDFVVDDFSGAADRLKNWFKVVNNDATRQVILTKFLTRQAQLALEDEDRRPKLLAIVDDWKVRDRAAKRRMAVALKAEEDAAAKPAVEA